MHRAELRLVLTLAALAGCGAPPAPPRDAAVPGDAAPFPAMVLPVDNPTTDERVELGRQLFHDPLLSSDRRVACVTCHGQIWGLADALPRSIGIDGSGPPGPGRYGPNETRRNALTLWNVGYRAALMWDGRAATLEAQALLPIANPVELNRPVADVVADLRASPAYRTLFGTAFPGEPEPVTAENLARAIASFERTLVSDRAPYDQFVYRGDHDAMSAAEHAGLASFVATGCPRCHAPPLFDSPRYERSPAPEVPGVTDEGRFEVTALPEDRGRFRVPTLRNLRVTGPYFHNGAVDTIERAVALCGAAGGSERPLETSEVEAIAVFLRKSLMDITRTPSRPVVAPSGLEVPRDTLDVPRWPMGDAGSDT